MNAEMCALNVVKVLCLVQIVFVSSLSAQPNNNSPSFQEQKFYFFASSELIYENVMQQVAITAICQGGGKLLDNKVSFGGVQGSVDEYDSVWGAVYLVDEVDYQYLLRYAQSRSQISFMSQTRVTLQGSQSSIFCRTIDVGIISSGFPSFSSQSEVAFETDISQYIERLRQLGASERYIRKFANTQQWMPAANPANCPPQLSTPSSMRRKRVTSKTLNRRHAKTSRSEKLSCSNPVDVTEVEESAPFAIENDFSPDVKQITKLETIKQDNENKEQSVTKVVTQKDGPGTLPRQETITVVSNDGPKSCTPSKNDLELIENVPKLVEEKVRNSIFPKEPRINNQQPCKPDANLCETEEPLLQPMLPRTLPQEIIEEVEKPRKPAPIPLRRIPENNDFPTPHQRMPPHLTDKPRPFQNIPEEIEQIDEIIANNDGSCQPSKKMPLQNNKCEPTQKCSQPTQPKHTPIEVLEEIEHLPTNHTPSPLENKSCEQNSSEEERPDEITLDQPEKIPRRSTPALPRSIPEVLEEEMEKPNNVCLPKPNSPQSSPKPEDNCQPLQKCSQPSPHPAQNIPEEILEEIVSHPRDPKPSLLDYKSPSPCKSEDKLPTETICDKPLNTPQRTPRRLSPTPELSQSIPEILEKELEKPMFTDDSSVPSLLNNPPPCSKQEVIRTPPHQKSIQPPILPECTPSETLEEECNPVAGPARPSNTPSSSCNPNGIDIQIQKPRSPRKPTQIPHTPVEVLEEEICNPQVQGNPSKLENSFPNKPADTLIQPMTARRTWNPVSSPTTNPGHNILLEDELVDEGLVRPPNEKRPEFPKQEDTLIELPSIEKTSPCHNNLVEEEKPIGPTSKPFKPLPLQNRSFETITQQMEQEKEKTEENCEKTIMEVLKTPKQDSTSCSPGKPTTTTVISNNGNTPTIIVNGHQVTSPGPCSQNNPTRNSPCLSAPNLLNEKREEIIEENVKLLNNDAIPKENLQSQSYTTFRSKETQNEKSTKIKAEEITLNRPEECSPNNCNSYPNSDHNPHFPKFQQQTRNEICKSQTSQQTQSQSSCSKIPSGEPDVQRPNRKTLIPGFTIAPLLAEFDVLSGANKPTFISEDATSQSCAGSSANIGAQNCCPPSRATSTAIATSDARGSSTSNANPNKIMTTPILTPNAKGINIQVQNPNGAASTTQITSSNGDGSTVSTMSVSSNNNPRGSTKLVGIRNDSPPGGAAASSTAISTTN